MTSVNMKAVMALTAKHMLVVDKDAVWHRFKTHQRQKAVTTANYMWQ